MKAIRTLFWDVGGVLLTNAWDHEERERAVENFQLQKADFEARHKEVVPAFEEGKVTLDQYLDRTVFYQPRKFSKDDFKNDPLIQKALEMFKGQIVEVRS